jgi:hypothetical protein
MEQSIGRKLKCSELVHHINYNRSDNRIDNLEIMVIGKHTTLHKTGKYWHDGTSKTNKYCPVCGRVLPRTDFYHVPDKTRYPETEVSLCKICSRHSQHSFVKKCPICNGTILQLHPRTPVVD